MHDILIRGLNKFFVTIALYTTYIISGSNSAWIQYEMYTSFYVKLHQQRN